MYLMMLRKWSKISEVMRVTWRPLYCQKEKQPFFAIIPFWKRITRSNLPHINFRWRCTNNLIYYFTKKSNFRVKMEVKVEIIYCAISSKLYVQWAWNLVYWYPRIIIWRHQTFDDVTATWRLLLRHKWKIMNPNISKNN